MEGVWFPDEAEAMEGWYTFRKEMALIEGEHLEIRVALHEAEAALRNDPENESLTARVKYLRKRLAELERKAPWLSSDIAAEVLLWGGPFGC